MRQNTQCCNTGFVNFLTIQSARGSLMLIIIRRPSTTHYRVVMVVVGGKYWQVGWGRAGLVFWLHIRAFLGPNWAPEVWTGSVLLQEIISLS